MINMLIALMNKAHSTPEQISNVNKEMEILRKYKKEMPEVQNATKEVKNAFDGLISRPDVAK